MHIAKQLIIPVSYFPGPTLAFFPPPPWGLCPTTAGCLLPFGRWAVEGTLAMGQLGFLHRPVGGKPFPALSCLGSPLGNGACSCLPNCSLPAPAPSPGRCCCLSFLTLTGKPQRQLSLLHQGPAHVSPLPCGSTPSQLPALQGGSGTLAG